MTQPIWILIKKGHSAVNVLTTAPPSWLLWSIFLDNQCFFHSPNMCLIVSCIIWTWMTFILCMPPMAAGSWRTWMDGIDYIIYHFLFLSLYLLYFLIYEIEKKTQSTWFSFYDVYLSSDINHNYTYKNTLILFKKHFF